MKTIYFRIIFLIIYGLLSPLSAHSLLLESSLKKAVEIRLFYADHTPFAFEACEVFLKGSQVPEFAGRTTQNGSFTFIPSKDGNYDIRCHSEDGHGIIQEIPLKQNLEDVREVHPSFENSQFLRILAGAAIVFLLFHLISRFSRRA